MSDLRLMWRNTRMIVLCAISAALYASVLVPFKVVPLIPGVTELRPANAIPIVCSFMFGPAAAWGSAIGNMIGDFFGGIGPGDFFGFFANLVFGWAPYKVWSVIGRGRSPVSRAPADIARYVVACLVGSSLCAVIVGWGENCLGLRPFALLGNVIIFNNMVAALLLSPFLLAAIYPRVQAGRMLYQDVMPELPRRARALQVVGLMLLVIGTGVAWLAGNLISTGRWVPHFIPVSMAHSPYDGPIAIVVTPFVVMATAGLSMM
jgi:energy-coupling factor transport system substrate-specific component